MSEKDCDVCQTLQDGLRDVKTILEDPEKGIVSVIARAEGRAKGRKEVLSVIQAVVLLALPFLGGSIWWVYSATSWNTSAVRASEKAILVIANNQKAVIKSVVQHMIDEGDPKAKAVLLDVLKCTEAPPGIGGGVSPEK